MVDLHPEERIWVRPVRRGFDETIVGYRTIGEQDKFHEIREVEDFDDFLYRQWTTNVMIGPWLPVWSGGTSTISQAGNFCTAAARNIGGIVMQGDGAGGVASITLAEQTTSFGYAECRHAFRLTLTENAATDYRVSCGWHDALTAGSLDATDGAWWEYDRSLTAGFWRCKTAAGGAVTTTVSTFPASVNTFVVLEVHVAEDRGNVWFRANGVNYATHTANIPNQAAAQNTGIGLRIQKTAGATTRAIYVDWFRQRYTSSGANVR